MPNRNKKERPIVRQEAQSFHAPNPLQVMAAFRKSPLPPPAELEKYETILPGATKILFDNFIEQTNHRMALEKTVISGDDKRANRGQHYSFILIILMILLSALLFILGKDFAAAGVIIGAIGTSIVSFITVSVQRKNERQEKRKSQGGGGNG